MTRIGDAARRPILGVLLDKDGTLFDFQATWGGWSRQMIEAESRGDPGLAARIAEALGYDMGRGRFRPDSIAISATTETVAEHLLPLLPWTSKAELMDRMDERAKGCPQVEAAPLREVLGRLRDMGVALGVATNDSEAPARAHLAGVADLLPFVAGFDSGFGGKPGPGQLLAFARATRLDPASCAMVGDSLHDLAAARAAGMAAVAVLTGLAGAETLAPAADVVLHSVADLPKWVASQG